MDENNSYGLVSLVGAGPGDPGLITLRGVECLAKADVVVYDRLANPLLLKMAPQAEWIPVGKLPNHHPIPQEKINAVLIEKASQGKRVVRLKGGDPFIFGRGGEEALALAEAGIAFNIVPGVSSAIAAPAYAGIPLTHRDVACSTALITGHRAEWIENPEDDWQRCSLGADTLVFLMGVKNLPRIVEQLLESDRPLDTPVALVERGTSAAQKTVTGTLENIVQRSAEIRPPAVIVIGEVVRMREQLRWYDASDHRPLFGMRVLNTKTLTAFSESYPLWSIPPLDEFDNQVLSLGGEAIHLPVIQIVPPSDHQPLKLAAQRLVDGSTYGWIVFTSANAVSALFEQLASLSYDTRHLSNVRVAAIGQATVQALSVKGINPDFVPLKFTGAQLGEQLPLQPGESVFLPRSEVALPELPRILEERGAIVDEVIAYAIRNAPPDTLVLDQLVDGAINVVTFFSPSGISGLADMLAEGGYSPSLQEILSPLTVACIGPSTAKAVRSEGLVVDVVAQDYTASGLVEALVKWQKRS
jgi:uroporphyrinogen III methyltransferase/synthase